MLFSVPEARSSLGFPATVTRPCFTGCLNWRWLPRVATSSQPSLRRSSSISLTFMVKVCHGLPRSAHSRSERHPRVGGAHGVLATPSGQVAKPSGRTGTRFPSNFPIKNRKSWSVPKMLRWREAVSRTRDWASAIGGAD